MTAEADPAPILLDTDVYSLLQLGDSAWASLLRGHELVLSFVTVGEVLHGKHKLGWGTERIGDQIRQLQTYRTIPGSHEVAAEFGSLARWFKGQMPDDDLWVAACALAVPIPLATGDATHFDPIAARFGLTIVRP
jgi:predicted nucleic acid-binding protein